MPATVEYAAVPIIDFSKTDTPEGREDLALKVRDAMHTCGFMCIVNHGLTQIQVSPYSKAYLASTRDPDAHIGWFRTSA